MNLEQKRLSGIDLKSFTIAMALELTSVYRSRSGLLFLHCGWTNIFITSWKGMNQEEENQTRWEFGRRKSLN